MGVVFLHAWRTIGGWSLLCDQGNALHVRWLLSHSATSPQSECHLLGPADVRAHALLQMARGADPQTRPQVLEILDDAQSLGLKVLRMWAFGEGPLQYNSLQRYPGAQRTPPQLPASVGAAPGISFVCARVRVLGPVLRQAALPQCRRV